MENFTPFSSIAGGVLIGLAATLLLWGIGRIAGISGILDGAFRVHDAVWRRVFLFGLVFSGLILAQVSPSLFVNTTSTGTASLIVAGLLVGFGTRLGSGCTSGHGVCGLPRFSLRSFVAVGTFMMSGALTMLVMRGLS